MDVPVLEHAERKERMVFTNRKSTVCPGTVCTEWVGGACDPDKAGVYTSPTL